MTKHKFGEVEFDMEVFDSVLARGGLCAGVGTPDGKMCVEAAISVACGLPFGDEPVCVHPLVREFKIRLNDSCWSSDRARGEGLRKVGVAQLGSQGIDGTAFLRRVNELTVREILPTLFRELFTDSPECLAAADRCEREGTDNAAAYAANAAYAAARTYAANAADAAYAAYAAYADNAAAYAANAANAANAAYAAARTDAAYAAAYAARTNAAHTAAYAAGARADKYLLMSADICLRVLKELGSPGCSLLAAE